MLKKTLEFYTKFGKPTSMEIAAFHPKVLHDNLGTLQKEGLVATYTELFTFNDSGSDDIFIYPPWDYEGVNPKDSFDSLDIYLLELLKVSTPVYIAPYMKKQKFIDQILFLYAQEGTVIQFENNEYTCLPAKNAWDSLHFFVDSNILITSIEIFHAVGGTLTSALFFDAWYSGDGSTSKNAGYVADCIDRARKKTEDLYVSITAQSPPVV